MDTTWREELAWAAGFFDGEGWVGTSRSYALRVPRLSVYQKDRRALDRFRRIVGVGRIYRDTRREQCCFFQATSLNHVQAIIALLWPWLGPVKREQARLALGVAVSSYRGGVKSPRMRNHCKRGHVFSPANTLRGIQMANGRQYVKRICRACVHDRVVEKAARFLLSA